MQFLVMHYLTDDLNDKDNDRDMQLPFKSTTHARALNSTALYISCYYSSLLVKSFVIAEKDIYLPQKEFFLITDYQSLVWHPPDFS
jgi:hypothetical protein